MQKNIVSLVSRVVWLPAFRPTWDARSKRDLCALEETGRHPPEASDEQKLYQLVAREGLLQRRPRRACDFNVFVQLVSEVQHRTIGLAVGVASLRITYAQNLLVGYPKVA